MSTLTWLHLSDLHACRPRTGWDSAKVTETLIADLRRLDREEGLRPDLIFFTGDAAFGHLGSKPEETLAGQFEEAATFLTAVRRAYVPEVPAENLFLVPGNHDIHRGRVSEIDTFFLDAANLEKVEALFHKGGSDWRRIAERLEDYQTFLASHDFEHLIQDRERSLYALVREVAGLRIGIAGFNTAWSCCRDGERGKLWMAGHWQQETLRQKLAGTDLSIALLHHPPDWFGELEMPAFRRELRQDFRFLLHGHEHKEWVESTDDGFVTVSAGACYDRSDRQNGYNLVRFDGTTGKGEVWLRRYDRSSAEWLPRPIGGFGKPGQSGRRPFELKGLVRQVAPASQPPPRKAGPPAAEKVPTVPASDPLAAVARRYQERLRAACLHLPIAGFSRTRVRLPICLEDVYIPLRAAPQHRALEKEQKTLGATREWAAEEREIDLPFDAVFPWAKKKGLRGAVVLGDPGSGKTTLLKHFVLATTGLADPTRLGLPAGVIPVLVELRRLSDPAAGLEAALTEALRLSDIALKADAPALAGWLVGRDELLVLIDGLDEVADAEVRAAVARWLEEAVNQLPRSFFVLTSRYAGYRESSRLDGRFLELRVRDLVPAEAQRFLAAWYRAVEEQAEVGTELEVARSRAEEGAADLAERLFAPPETADLRTARLAELTTNPLLLQIVCLVHRDRKSLPERRVELYEECVGVLLETWREAKKLPVRLTTSKARKLLEPLAWWMHTGERREAKLEEILPVLAEPLRVLGQAGQGTELLAALRDQSGLLVFLGQGTWGFLHQSFQEYLAACHVQDRSLEGGALLADLAGHFGKGWWREVLLLALGLERPSLFKPLLREILKQERLHCDPRLAGDCLRDAAEPAAEPFLEALAAGIRSGAERYHALQLLRLVPGWMEVEVGGVSGRAIVERLREDGKPQVKSLAVELVGAPVVPARPAGRSYTQGEERIHEVDGSVLVFVPGGEYTMGAEDITDEEKPVHKVTLSPFWVGKYPVTCQQYGQFLAARPEHPKPAAWDDKRFNQPRQPVVGVSWEDARVYCEWAGLLLPSEAQWEAAARGPEARRFPWGNDEPTPRHANFDSTEGGPTPVGNYPLGVGPFGTLDQAGNVWEWCLDVWDAEAYRDRNGKKDPVSPEGEAAGRSLRGGAWDYPAGHLAAAYRDGDRAADRDGGVGFRVCLPLRAEP